jgi:hypothetical protein
MGDFLKKLDVDKIRDKVGDLADEHGEKVEGAIDKAADFVDDKTKGKHKDKIEQAAGKAKDLVQKAKKDDDPPSKSKP